MIWKRPLNVSPAAYRGPDLERAKKLLAEAGYPNGEGLPCYRFQTEEEIAKLWGGNLLRVWREAERVATEEPS